MNSDPTEELDPIRSDFLPHSSDNLTDFIVLAKVHICSLHSVG